MDFRWGLDRIFNDPWGVGLKRNQSGGIKVKYFVRGCCLSLHYFLEGGIQVNYLQ